MAGGGAILRTELLHTSPVRGRVAEWLTMTTIRKVAAMEKEQHWGAYAVLMSGEVVSMTETFSTREEAEKAAESHFKDHGKALHVRAVRLYRLEP